MALLASIAAAMGALRLIRILVWPTGQIPLDPFQKIASYGALLWALPAIPALLSLIGFMLSRGAPARRGDKQPTRPVPAIRTSVCFRLVTRGQNVAAVQRSVDTIYREMARTPLFPFTVEVVSERRLPLTAWPRLRQLVVPAAFQTPQRSLFKARALEYALKTSRIADDSWLMHLDEESRITQDLIVGIRDAVEEEERTGEHRIGQGAILYHADLPKHPFLTLADMIRTGDDLGRFYLQHRLGVTLFGLHGSFILVRASVEREVGFDFGPEGSITEDAFWAVQQTAQGRRCRWVDGYLLEQSTRSLLDFIKQRRRWFSGMVRTVVYAPTSVWIRWPLALFVALWSVSWLAMSYTVVNIFLGLRTPFPITIMADFAYSTYLVSYLYGLAVNLRERATVRIPVRMALYAAQVVLLPVFTLLEGAGVVAALISREHGFHVVRK